jgi:hypothetical protein
VTLPGVGIDPAVVDPRRGHLDRTGRGQHLAGLMRAVADHQPPSCLVALVSERGDVGVDLGLQRGGQHPLRPVADDGVDQRRRPLRSSRVLGIVGSRNYREHGSYLPDQRCSAGLA